MEGQIFAGKYRMVRILGKGGMGAVWLAEHITLKTPVAVKLIDSEIAKNPGVRKRFDREAQIAARIRSAHVVQVLDHGETESGMPYIAMECLTGENLRDRLTARTRLMPVEVARIVSHACRAMARAHEAGLVHRDLKPENLFISRDDDQEVVKVLDFGVAKVADYLTSDGMDPTRTGALMGTPFYMSPEQAQGLRTLDYRSDLWSLGVVVFECLTGHRPFLAPALGPLIAKICLGPIPLPSQVGGANSSPEIDAWMQKALSRDPALRFASARELAESFMIASGAAESSGGRTNSSPPIPSPPQSLPPPPEPLSVAKREDFAAPVPPPPSSTTPHSLALATSAIDASAIPGRRSIVPFMIAAIVIALIAIAAVFAASR